MKDFWAAAAKLLKSLDELVQQVTGMVADERAESDRIRTQKGRDA